MISGRCGVHAGDGVHSPLPPRTRRAGWLLFAAFLLVGSGVAPVAAQLAVNQAEVFLEPRTPGRGVISFDISNAGDQVAEATLYLSDWDRTETGDHRFLPSGTLPRSCARYLRVFPLSLRLPARATQSVRVALEGADSLAATCWSIVFVESRIAPTGLGAQVTYVTRLGVKVYGLPPGLTREGEVVDLAAGRDSAGRHIEVGFANTGGQPLWVRGALEYRRLDNSLARRDTIPQFPVLPGARRRVSSPLPVLPAGRYVVLALLDYAGAEVAAGQLQLEVP